MTEYVDVCFDDDISDFNFEQLVEKLCEFYPYARDLTISVCQVMPNLTVEFAVCGSDLLVKQLLEDLGY